tara:strand:+ start:83566 stop:84045 length:480 start_codon:yes stop_codon:yes gene_type:complete
MSTDFNSMPEESKIWVFPSSKKIHANQTEDLEKKVGLFINNWTESNPSLKATSILKYNRFIIICASSEESISTTITNELIAFIFELQAIYETELMDKMNACFKQGEFVQYKELKDFKKLIKDKAVNKNTIVFDNLVATKYEFDNYWETPASESWYGNMF